jgi:hypothetical protein
VSLPSVGPVDPASPAPGSVLAEVAEAARRAGVFGGVVFRAGGVGGPGVECAAKDAGAPAFYRAFVEAGSFWVALVTPDRWLSQSIEADLVHTGDKLEDLIEEELVDQGLENLRPRLEHFRSEDRLFTFRSPVPDLGSGVEARVVVGFLLAYEACFRNLGDMAGGDED